ncbi:MULTISPECIES: hypothetical protein [unclassified Pantoea]|uniref:hypothetical protein n=1 Tax=unclassified Pantoea TaxID=2630326 RepID=UPI002553BE29|nr:MULTISPECIES: hypothetical protein [unclassified Pantoea]
MIKLLHLPPRFKLFPQSVKAGWFLILLTHRRGCAMNLKQLDSIAQFYNQLLLQVRFLKFSKRRTPEEEKKELLVNWLIEEKKLKNFGEECRHEIVYMILELENSSLRNFESKVEHLETNCAAIRLEMEMSQALKRETSTKSGYG